MSQDRENLPNITEETSSPSTQGSPAKNKKPNSGATFGKTLLLYLHDVVYLLAIFLVVLLIVFRVVVVSGPSMKDTLLDGDNLLVLSSTFYNNPKCGDVVIITKKSFENGDPIIKRVIATENHWVNIDFETGTVYVGKDLEHMEPLDESYTRAPTTLREGVKFPLYVPEGMLFVMGDNRNESKDSRSPEIGLVDEREIIGKAFFLVFPGTDGGKQERDFGRIGGIG